LNRTCVVLLTGAPHARCKVMSSSSRGTVFTFPFFSPRHSNNWPPPTIIFLETPTQKPRVQESPVEPLPTFKPELLTPESTRQRVTSSGYGSGVYTPKVVKDKPSPAPAEDPEATFKPNLMLTKKVRRL
jgi:hypothetical protein